MTIQQVKVLDRKNYVRPMNDREYGYKLFCRGGSLPADCSKEMLAGWARAWRVANPWNRPPFSGDFSDVEPAENRADWVGA